jgi:fimbrial chaperone protein
MFKFIFLITILVSNIFAWDVKPMSKDIKQGERSYQLKISNKDGKVPVAVRLSAMKRDVDNLGDDKLSPTKDIIVFPKQLIVKPGKVAIARVSVRKANTSNVEGAYRIIADQVPVRRADEKRGIKVLTRYLTSIYLEPKGKKVEDFSFADGNIDNKSITLSAVNNGNVHKVILPTSIVVTKNDNTKVAVEKKFEVVNVMPNKTVDIVLPLSSEVLTNAKAISFSNTCVTCGGEAYEVVLSQ